MSAEQLGPLLGPLALTAFLLVVVVWGGRKRWWVFGWQFDKVEREAQEWKRLALAQAGLLEETAERATRLVEKAIDR